MLEQHNARAWARRVNWLWIAVAITIAYGGWLLCSIGYSRITTFLHDEKIELNQVGDFLAGAFAPIALIWLVAAVLTQRQELNETREQFDDSQKVTQKQLDLVEKAGINQHNQAVRDYKLSLFEYRIAIFNQVDEIARDLRNEITDHTARVFSGLAQRSYFIFDAKVSDKLRRASILTYELADLAKQMNVIRPADLIAQFNGETSLSESDRKWKKSLEDGFKKGMEELIELLSYESRMEMFAPFLMVTDTALEAKVDGVGILPTAEVQVSNPQ